MRRFSIFICLQASLFASIMEPISVALVRISFEEDSTNSTTGNGQFLLVNEGTDCGPYTIDPPPHDYNYFLSQLHAVNQYFENVSYGKFGIDLAQSSIYPSSLNGNYQLSNTMDFYNPYDDPSGQEGKLTKLFKDAIEQSYSEDAIEFSKYDLVVVFHAGIGQDFSLPFLDPTPEDIPSTYIDEDMIQEHLGESNIIVGNHAIQKGIILPETQNHLLYDISETMFYDAENPCEYQYGITGTFSLMIGFAIGLPPLWNIQTGESGVGVFGLMDQGSNNGRGIIPAPPTAWSRIYAGWENYVIGELGSEYHIPTRSENSIIKVPIRENEYYLIESRSNWIKPKVSIDSLRYEIGSNSSSNIYPPYIEILIDSSGLERDSNGVFTFVPNYDIGLPESGLLIWHIDEAIINDGIFSYSINSDLLNRGVDLEEADGAQDIGYVSLDIFNDPTSGWFGDMWYKGNSQYMFANPNMNGFAPLFGPETYPSTRANDHSHSYIMIGDISKARDTMSFTLTNSYIPNLFPDTTLAFKASFDFNNDGLDDIVGGEDSVYLQLNDEDKVRRYFHYPEVRNFDLIFKNYDSSSDIHVFEFFSESVKHYHYNYNLINDSINIVSFSLIDSLLYPVVSEDSMGFTWKNYSQWDSHKKRVVASPNNFHINVNNRGIQVEKFGDSLTKWESKQFAYIAGIDIDLDSNVDLIALDTSGTLYLFNYDLILMPSFPLNIKLSPPILSQNIIGDEFPEIIGKSKDNKRLHIFNSKGMEILSMATSAEDSLLALGEYDGLNTIFAKSTIYQFDPHENPLGNKWSMIHGDIGKSRQLSLDYVFEEENKNLLHNTYCYPNPITENGGTIRVETFGSTEVHVDIYDLAGYFIKSFKGKSIHSGIQIKEFPWVTLNVNPGVYFAHVSAINDNKTQTKIIKIAVVD